MSVSLPTVSPLLRAFRGRDRAAQEAATRELIRLGRPAAEALALKLGDSEEAARALVAMGEAAVPTLVEVAADSGRPTLAWKAANLLVRIGESTVAPIVARIALLDGRNKGDALIYALSEIGAHCGDRAAEVVVPCLVEVLRHGEPSARLMAVMGLEKNAHAAAKAATALVRALEDWSLLSARAESEVGVTADLRREEIRQFGERLREHAVSALVRIGRGAVPALVESWRLHAGDRYSEDTVGRALESIAEADHTVLPLLVGTVDARPRAVAGPVTTAVAEPVFATDGVVLAAGAGHTHPPAAAGEAAGPGARRYILVGFVTAFALFVIVFLALLLDIWAVIFPVAK